MCEIDMGHFANLNLSVAVVRCWYSWCVDLHRNPNLDDPIYDCLLTAMAAVQAADERASFLFVGDSNGHHEWLGVAALDFVTVRL